MDGTYINNVIGMFNKDFKALEEKINHTEEKIQETSILNVPKKIFNKMKLMKFRHDSKKLTHRLVKDISNNYSSSDLSVEAQQARKDCLDKIKQASDELWSAKAHHGITNKDFNKFNEIAKEASQTPDVELTDL